MGLTKDEAARLAKVSLSTWHTVENAGPDTTFREITLAGVAAALGLDVDTVFHLAGMELPGTEGAVQVAPQEKERDELSFVERVKRDVAFLTEGEAAAVAAVIGAILAARRQAGPISSSQGLER